MTIQEYLTKLTYFLGFDQEEIQILQTENDQAIKVELVVPEDRANQLIGNFGQNIRAIRLLLKNVFQEQLLDKKISFDVNGYFRRKEEMIVAKAIELAKKVLETGQPLTLFDLNSFERYLVHSQVASNPELSGLGTYSTWVGDKRYLTICLVEDLPEQTDLDEHEQSLNY